ncbi:MAG: hypothetical protein QOD43_864 [Gaiellaceae bacterium]|nr:hypothetical protein [Gaiellaceae bacterium]
MTVPAMTRGQTPAVAKPAISNGKCLLASIYNKLKRCKKNGCTDMSRVRPRVGRG